MKHKLEYKLIISLVSILSLGIITISTLVIRTERQNIYKLSSERLMAMVQSIYVSIELSMLEGKADLSKSLADKLKHESGFALDIYNWQGREAFNPLAPVTEDSDLRATLQSGTELIREKPGGITVYKPMNNLPSCQGCHRDDKPVIGAIRMTVSLNREEKHIRSFMLSVVVGSFIGVFLIAVLIWLILRTQIIKPLKSLESSSHKMAAGDLTFKTNIDNQDEIGRLDSSIRDAMVSMSSVLRRVKDVSHRIQTTADNVERDSDKVIDSTMIETEAVEEISSSVEELNAAIAEIADGTTNLSKSVEETASSMEQMTTSIGLITTITHDVAEAVDSTSSSIEELYATIKQVSERAEELSNVSEETLSAIEEIISSVKVVEENASVSSRLSEDVAHDAATLGVSAVEKMKEGMEQIRDSVSRTAKAVEKLGGRSEEIGNIINVIDDIADQTTLLALNAAILAAQAGEHGKGFSVVANEIKDLAERTAISTHEIDSLIKAVRGEVKEAVDAMDNGMKAVVTGASLTKDASSSLRKILDSSKRAQEMSASIERSTAEQSRTARYVSEAIERVRSMVDQITRATSEQTKGVNLIITAAERMRDASHKADSAIDQQAVGSKQIARSIESVAERTKQISRAINEQKQGSRRILTSVEKIKNIPHANRDLSFSINKAVRELSHDAELVSMEMERFTLLDQSQKDVVRFGIVPFETPAVLFRKFSPLMEHLSNTLGKRFELRVASDFKSAITELGQGDTQLCYFGPMTYIEAAKIAGVKPLVKTLRSGKPFHRSAIITRVDSKVKVVADLANLSFAFVDRYSASGYILPLKMLKDSGLSMDSLSYFNYLGHHEDVVDAVLKGEFDAGAVMENIALAHKNRGLRILTVSKDIPDFNVSCGTSMSEADSEEVKRALLGITANKDLVLKVLSVIDKDITGFDEARDSDFNEIRSIVAEVEG